MSRTVKNCQNELFNKLPQKTTTVGFYDGVEEELYSPQTFEKPPNSVKETALGSDLVETQDLPTLSPIQQRLILRVSELFEELKSQQSGLSYQVRMCRSGPIVSMTMLNNKKDQEEEKKVSSQKEISIQTSKTSRRLRCLASLNPNVIQPMEVLERFFSMTEIEDEVYLIAMIYLKRALDYEPELEFEHFHKLLAGCLLLAHKYLIEGQYWDFEDFGFLSGVNPGQLEKIEKCVLRRVLCYDLYVSEEEYQGALRRLLVSPAF